MDTDEDTSRFGRARDRRYVGLGGRMLASSSSSSPPPWSSSSSNVKKKKSTMKQQKQINKQQTKWKGGAEEKKEKKKAEEGGQEDEEDEQLVATKWQGPFFFLQLADTQFGFYTENLSWDKEIALATRAVRCINAMRPRPRFVIVCGDLVHAYPWQQPAYDRQDFKRVMRKIDPSIPLVCLCGNHDIGNTPTRETISSYKERFGDDYFRFWVGGVCCLVINATLFHDPSMALEEYEEQRAWFINELQTFTATRDQTKAKHLFVFQHQPWFLEEPDEKDDYFNIPKERRMPMLEELTKAGVSAVFAGHYHRNSYGKLGKMEMITTSAVGRPLGADPSGFRVVKVNEDGIEHAYYGLDRLENDDIPHFSDELSFRSPA